MRRTNFIPILLLFFLTIFCTLCLFFLQYFAHLFNTKKNASLSRCFFFFLTIFCTLMPSFFLEYFVHLCLFLFFIFDNILYTCLFFDNILYTYLILKKCITPISFLSCCLFFFDNILYAYLIRLQTEYLNFHANSATLISM